MRIQCTEELHRYGGPGRFVLSHAEDALPSLVDAYRGKIQLIYLDPPFGTGDSFRLKLGRGKKTLTLPAFSDTLSEETYLDWMRIILRGCHEMLAPTGALYLHIDYRMSAVLRLLLDEIFGRRNFMNEIIWSYKTGGRSTLRRYNSARITARLPLSPLAWERGQGVRGGYAISHAIWLISIIG